MTRTVTEAGLAFTDPAAYADEERLHEAFALLRREDPVHWVEAAGFDPFWAVTRHADIMEIERNNALFLNAPRPLLATAVMDAQAKQREAEGTALRTLIHMDDPQHKVVRAIGAGWFRPRAMRRWRNGSPSSPASTWTGWLTTAGSATSSLRSRCTFRCM